MENKIYLHIPEQYPEDRSIIFFAEGVHNIGEEDIAIPREDWEGINFANMQLRNPLPKSERLADLIELHEPEGGDFPENPIKILQIATAEAIEKQENDKIEQQLAQAEMFETLLQMLEPQGGGE